MKYKLQMKQDTFNLHIDAEKIQMVEKLGFTLDAPCENDDPNCLFYNGETREIELNTLEDLTNFIEEFGHCTVSRKIINIEGGVYQDVDIITLFSETSRFATKKYLK